MLLELGQKSDRVVVIEMAERDDSKGTQSSSIIHSLNFVSLGLESCYHSSIVPSKEDTFFGKNYGPELAVYGLKQTRNSLQYSRKHGLRCRCLQATWRSSKGHVGQVSAANLLSLLFQTKVINLRCCKCEERNRADDFRIYWPLQELGTDDPPLQPPPGTDVRHHICERRSYGEQSEDTAFY